MAKLKTQEQLDRATDLRLQRVYGLSLDEYNRILESQLGGCAICKKLPTNRRLHVDHDHKSHKIKINAARHKYLPLWLATADYNGKIFVSSDKKKSLVIRSIKKQVRRASCRGLLCAHCNRGLQYYKDNPIFMRTAAEYLERHQCLLF